MNKFLILITAFLFLFKLSNAQTEKGSQTLGVNLGFTSLSNNDFAVNPFNNATTTSNSKTTNFTIGPNYSYFVANNLEVAASLSYNSGVTTTTDNGPYRQSLYNYGALIAVRKYFMYANKIGIRTGPYINYSYQNQQINYTGSNAIDNLNSKTNNYAAGANLDLVYFPSKKLGFSASIANVSYQHFSDNNGNQGHESGNDVNFNFVNNGLVLSVFYVFGNK